jgi:prepilin-type N-terminal cleavage/methylation domain-containing protein
MERTPIQQTCGRQTRVAFTLVELLVVITIIGILAALITAAGAGALKRAQQTRIKTEVDQLAMALQSYKDTAGSYPPNCQVDGPAGSDPIDESQVLNDIKRAFKQAFPRHREPPELIAALAGMSPDGLVLPTNQNLQGGMTAGEALVFWLGGFSSDPKFPISGEGGPAYRIPNMGGPDNYKLDPIESRKWIYPFELARLQPRNTDNYFDASQRRFIEYAFGNEFRRINFWQYVPGKSEQPLLYFDTSRHPAAVASGGNVFGPFDPPAATQLSGLGLHVHAVKTRNSTFRPGQDEGAVAPIQFANQDKFQILHCGLDEEWGDAFEEMSAHGVSNPRELDSYLIFPDGPFTGEVADTITNFSEGTLEASQP